MFVLLFNQLIEDCKEIRTFDIPKMWGLGTPEDLKYYLEKIQMRLISHRGNVDGKYPQYENEPEYVDKHFKEGYDVEIDLWIDNDGFYLGHDEPTYPIDLKWLTDRYLTFVDSL